MEKIICASEEDLSLCSGLGPQKVRTLISSDLYTYVQSLFKITDRKTKTVVGEKYINKSF